MTDAGRHPIPSVGGGMPWRRSMEDYIPCGLKRAIKKGDVVVLGVPAGVEHHAMEDGGAPLGQGLGLRLLNDRLEPFEADHVPPGIHHLHGPVAVEQQGVLGGQFDRLRLVHEIREDAQGKVVVEDIHILGAPLLRPVDQGVGLAGVDDLQHGRVGLEFHHVHGQEQPLLDLVGEGLVQLPQDAVQGFGFAEQGLEGPEAEGHGEGRRHPLAAHIPDARNKAARRVHGNRNRPPPRRRGG